MRFIYFAITSLVGGFLFVGAFVYADVTQSGQCNAASTTCNVTVVADDYVVITVWGGSGTYTSVAIDGEVLTADYVFCASGAYCGATYSTTATSSGTKTVTASGGSPSDIAVAAYTGGASITNTNSASSDCSSCTVTATASADGSYAVFSQGSDGVISGQTGVTQIYSANSTQKYMGDEAINSGNTSLNYTVTAGRWSLYVIEPAAVGGGGATTTQATSTQIQSGDISYELAWIIFYLHVLFVGFLFNTVIEIAGWKNK